MAKGIARDRLTDLKELPTFGQPSDLLDREYSFCSPRESVSNVWASCKTSAKWRRAYRLTAQHTFGLFSIRLSLNWRPLAAISPMGFAALRVLQGEFGEGDTVVVDAGRDGLTFEKRQSVKA